MLLDLLFLFAAGFVAGIINSLAGGGSFISFPALLMAGVPPISANATNTFASCAGYLSGAYAFRNDLKAHHQQLPMILLTSLAGGLLGAWLLLQTPEQIFQDAIPWLLLLATLLFIYGGQLNAFIKNKAGKHKHASTAGAVLLALLLLGVCTYGGFFNAGLGIITLSFLTLAGHTDINAMNGLKLLISSAVSLFAITLFIIDDAIAWEQGTTLLFGTLAGGYVAAHQARKLPQQTVRRCVIFASVLITGYFFADTYLY